MIVNQDDSLFEMARLARFVGLYHGEIKFCQQRRARKEKQIRMAVGSPNFFRWLRLGGSDNAAIAVSQE